MKQVIQWIIIRLKRRSLWAARWLADRAGRIVLPFIPKRKGRVGICVWATVLQTDILCLTHALDSCDEVDLLVVTPYVKIFLNQPIQKVKPLRCRILDRRRWFTLFKVRLFRPHLVIIDDLLPAYPLGAKILYLWHGLGMWKVKPRGEIAGFTHKVERYVGDVTQPNDRFRAQGYGEITSRWWSREWGFAPENCKNMGMAYSDWIMSPPYSKSFARKCIGIPENNKPTVLLSLTWHYGSKFGLWGELTEIATQVLNIVDRYEGNLIFCLHDRNNFERSIVDKIYSFANRHTNIFLRPRNLYLDNLPEILAADIMISNYSSFLGYFYITGKPTIHLNPLNGDGSNPEIVSYYTGQMEMHRVNEKDVWLNSFENHGGIVVRNYAELTEGVEKALRNPDCCKEASNRFLKEQVIGLNGNTSKRMTYEIIEWIKMHKKNSNTLLN